VRSHQSRHDDRQRILDATDIVQLIGEHVALKSAGREYKGLCPFHDDTRPSMYVVPHKMIFKCFACGAGGSVFDFVMKYHNMDFREALEYLAQRAGIELTPRSPKSSTQSGDSAEHEGFDENGNRINEMPTADLVSAHRTALDFYRAILKHKEHGQTAKEIYTERGISQEMIDRFELGAAPDRWDGLVKTLQSNQVNLAPFISTGLISRKKDGEGYIDRFRNRLIFPIHDLLGRPIAFGARQIKPDDNPKYLNSPEHDKFKKSRTLYGMHLAGREIQKKRTAVLVEGYTDVIACHEAGFTNVIAALGTALTIEHAHILQRHGDRVVLIFDGDLAGQKAADRAVEIFFNTTVDVHIAVIPDDHDPADILAKPDGHEVFTQLIDSAPEALEYLLASLQIELQTDTQSGVSARQRVVQEFMNRLVQLGFHEMNPLRRDLIVSRLSEMLNLPINTIRSGIPKRKRYRPGGTGVSPVTPGTFGGAVSSPVDPPPRTQAESSEPDPCSGTGFQPVSGTGVSPVTPGATGRAESSPFDRLRIIREPYPCLTPTASDQINIESTFLACLIHSPALLEHIDQNGHKVATTVIEEWFSTPTHRSLYHLLWSASPEDRGLSSLLAQAAGRSNLSEYLVELQCRIEKLTGDDESKVLSNMTACFDLLHEINEAKNPHTENETLEEPRVAKVQESIARLRILMEKRPNRPAGRSVPSSSTPLRSRDSTTDPDHADATPPESRPETEGGHENA